MCDFYHRFQKSPLISTYLIAFSVNDLEEVVLTPQSNGVLHSIWARRDLVEAGWADYPASWLAKNLAVYEDLLQVPYPLPKLDTLVQPSKEGAMENW